jgi:predicted transcriptional regulator
MTEPPLRVLVCPNCGAPIQVAPAGGSITCTYCRVTCVLDARPALRSGKLTLLDPASPAERERVEKLRILAATYDDSEDRLSLNKVPQAYVDVDGFDMSRATAKRLDKAFRAAVAQRDEVPERTLWWLAERLVNLWNMRNDRARAGAVAQTAVEALVDPDFKHGMYTQLASSARHSDDLDEAETWLAQCNPATTQLALDNSFRTAVAHLCLARHDPTTALKMVGEVATTFPWAPPVAPMAWLLRAASHELRGAHASADEDLREIIEHIASETARNNPELDPDAIRDECRRRAQGWVANTLHLSETLRGALSVWHRLAAAGEFPPHEETLAGFKTSYGK